MTLQKLLGAGVFFVAQHDGATQRVNESAAIGVRQQAALHSAAKPAHACAWGSVVTGLQCNHG